MNKDGSVSPEQMQEMFADNDELMQFVKRSMAGKNLFNHLDHIEQIWRMLHEQNKKIRLIEAWLWERPKAGEAGGPKK